MPVSNPTVLTTATNDEGAANPFNTPSFTVAGNANNLVVLDLAQAYNATTVAAPTMSAGIGAGTLIAQSFDNNKGSGSWRWVGVPSGSYTISIAGVESYSIRVLEMDGVDQTTPITGAVAKHNQTDFPEVTPIPYTIASATGDMVMASMCSTEDPTHSQTLVGTEATFAYGSRFHNTQRAAGAASVEMTWTGVTGWTSYAYNVQAAAEGPAPSSQFWVGVRKPNDIL